ncbi:MAG TPA: CARDB domain-containing protein, partial [Candidatus Methanoperedens sp.]|nr:CARDB domain-containing protein [Candidatus Methanoperedens sp.]
MGKKLQGFVATAVVLLGLAPGAVALDKGPISSGETRSGTFTAGSNDVWSFTYAAGQVLNMRAAPPAPWSDRVETTIRDAGGTVRQTIACTGGTTNSASFVLPSTGTYTATVRSCSSTYAGAYNLSLLNVTAGPLRVSGDPTQEGQAIVSGQTVPGYMGYGDLDAFTLRVDAGERLVFSSSQQAVGPNPKLWLFPPITAPSPWVSLTSGNGDRQELSLTYPGTYTVVIQPQDLNSYGDYFLTLQKLPGATADCYTGLPDTDGGVIAAAPTANRSGSIVRKTDLDAYEFYATASQTATITTNRNLRVSLYAPQYVSYQREYGVPIFTNTATCTTSTTNNVTLPTSGFYELLVEECAVTAGGAYTVSLTLPAQTTPPPLVNPTPAACGNITNVFATDALSWDILPAGTNYQVYAQQWPLGGIGNLGNVIQPPSGRPVFPLPYETLLTGNIYSWYASAWDTLAYTYSPTYTFGLFCTPTVTVSPSSLDFGDVNVGSTSAPVTVTITNTGTCYEDPRVVSLPAAFAVLNDTCTSAPAGGHLAPSGDACSFQVTFSPTSQGPYAGGLTLDGFLPEAHGGIIDLAGRGIMPDLLLTALSDPPPAPLYGEYVDMTDTTENLGDGPAAASSVTYVFSADQVIDPGDPPALSGARATPVLAPAATSTGTTSVYLPENLPTGSWYVGACIDAADLIPESDENNNCIVSATAFLVSRDMAVVEVSDPAQPNPDGTFAFSDTTRNTGSQPVPATVTNYRLSLDQKISRLDPTFALTRAIPALTTNPDPGHVSLGSVVLTVPADTPRGSYYVAACADATAVVGESSETNNCRFSKTTIRVEPDLTVTAVTNPPAAGSAGTTFSVTDTTRNGGLAGAAASSTRYRLSLDTAITTTDPQLTGNRAVPALGIGEVSTGSITVTIPASVPQGTFYLAACADDGRVIPEADETNNCRVSTTTISITRPDLVVTAVGNPPASGSAGTSFSVTDTTRNNGSAAAGATATGFRLSSDATITTSDPALTGTRAVPALAALGGTSSGSATVTIPASIAPGLYYLGACADNANSAAESVETNNCLGAATRITVGAPDLRVTALANPPASALVGTPFGVTDTTANASATVAAVASVTKYRLSLDTTITANDPLLTGTRAVPALAASANSAGTVNVTIPASIAPGTYYLGACADDGKTVAETDEANNCRVSTTTLNLQKPDLSVSAV